MIHFLVPPKQTGGVYDFSCRLQEEIGRDAVSIVHLSRDNAAGLQIEQDDTVFLQFSGYGFEGRGVPVWLLRELEKRRSRIITLGVFFHELYAFGPPWTSSFWLSSVQRYISRRLVKLSDFWMTSREGSAGWLRQYGGDKPHAVLPVFSTIGESAETSSVRLQRVVVFGSPGLRQATYEAAGESLFTWAGKAALEVHDIGSPIRNQRVVEMLQANNVVQHGRLGDQIVRQVLTETLYGLLAYPVEYVAKSSVLAAYCAHGVCPILFSDSYDPADGLTAGVHYLPGLPGATDSGSAESVGRAAWSWYQPHSLAIHARTLKQMCVIELVFSDENMP